jgi:hypothetical protein
MLKDMTQMSRTTKSLITLDPLNIHSGKLHIHIGHGLIGIERLVFLLVDIHDGKCGLIALKRNDSDLSFVVEVLMGIDSILLHGNRIV